MCPSIQIPPAAGFLKDDNAIFRNAFVNSFDGLLEVAERFASAIPRGEMLFTCVYVVFVGALFLVLAIVYVYVDIIRIRIRYTYTM